MERLGRMDVNQDLRIRYSRQSLLPEIGLEGQALLASKRVLVVGAGGLGSPLLYYLVAAGIGHIGIVEGDTVNLSNLQRQILYTEADLDKSKADCAHRRLSSLNSHCDIQIYPYFFTSDNALTIASNYDLIVDGCDNNRTRYLMDNTARTLGIPYLYGAVSHFIGQCSLFHYQGSGGYSDLFSSLDEESDREIIPVLGAMPGILGSIMALETLKTLLGIGTSLAGKLLRIDALSLDIQLLDLQ